MGADEELDRLRSIVHEISLRVEDAGSLMATTAVEKALNGDTTFSDREKD